MLVAACHLLTWERQRQRQRGPLERAGVARLAAIGGLWVQRDPASSEVKRKAPDINLGPLYTRVHVCACVNVCTCAHVLTHIHTHVCTHTGVNMHVHAQQNDMNTRDICGTAGQAGRALRREAVKIPE